MSSDWPQISFADAPLTIIDGDRGSNYPKQSDFLKVGHCLFLNTGNVTLDGFKFEECSFITLEKDSILRKGKLIREDIVLTTRGTLGNTGFYNQKVEYDDIRINSGMVILRANKTKLNPYFLYLFLRSSSFSDQVKSLQSGSAQPQLPIRDMQRVEIPVPALKEQLKICNVMAALNDRITLLRETNTTLEAIAQALFKSWFVDFDPVHAKMQGREPEGMDEATAALFPSEFEESELGLVPKGWRVEDLGKVIPVKDGTHESPKPAETGFPLVTSRHITGGQIDFSNTYLISEVDFLNISKRSRVDRFDVLITMIGTVGIPIIVLNEETDFAIKNIGLFKTSSKIDLSHYLYLLLCSNNMQSYLEARLAGTTQKYLSLKALREIEILLPSDEVLTSFSEVMFPLFDKIYGNQMLISTLTTLRDTLLPRLISGQLRLPETADEIEEACV